LLGDIKALVEPSVKAARTSNASWKLFCNNMIELCEREEM
jgi:hypothetical protein